MENAIASCPTPILMLISGRCKECNPAAVNILQKPIEQIINKDIVAVIPDFPIDKITLGSTISDVSAVPYMPPDGNSLIFLTIRLVPVDKDTTVIYILDTTGKKNADCTEVMSLELTERIIFEMRKAVNGIVGSTILLSDTRLTRDQSESIRCIYDSQMLMTIVINDVSDYIKLKTGRMIVEAKSFNVNGFLEECMEQIKNRAQAKNIILRTKIGKHVRSQISSDPGILKKMIIKLLQNAIDFSKDGGAVDLIIKKNGHNAIQIQVIDRGCGMTEDVCKRIFVESNFSQAEGLGLSLILCKYMARLLGGDINYETAVGAGTTFFINLPTIKRSISGSKELRDKKVLVLINSEADRKIIFDTLIEYKAKPIVFTAVADAEAIIASGFHADAIIIQRGEKISAGKIPVIEITDEKLSVRDSSRTSLQRPIDKYKILELCKNIIVEDKRFLRKTSINILIVDDSPTSRIVVTKQLNHIGYMNIDVAVDGEDAVAKINNKKYDVIFLDLIMPKMSGLDVMAVLTTKFGTDTCPYVIAMTANELATDKTKCLRAGMKDFIVKPITTDNLERVLHNI